MKIGVVKTIQEEDLKKTGEIPAWVSLLLAPLNQFIEQIGRALQGNLTFEDNFLCRVRRIKCVDNVEQLVNPQAGTLRVYGVLPLSAGGLSIAEFKWVQKTDGTIGVTFQFTGGTEATCELLILLR